MQSVFIGDIISAIGYTFKCTKLAANGISFWETQEGGDGKWYAMCKKNEHPMYHETIIRSDKEHMVALYERKSRET